MTSVPMRTADEVLATTEYVTVPLPLPRTPAVMVSHSESLEAIHAQPDGEATFTLPVPPPAETDADAGVIS